MAAVQLARHLGAEVFATASPGKWDDACSRWGWTRRISPRRARWSSRSASWRRPAAGAWMLSWILLPGSSWTPRLGCCAEGGRFVEMGKTDIRDAE